MRKTKFLLIWWYSTSMRSALVDDYEDAKKLAQVHNAVVLEVSGKDLAFGRLEDWYRRSDEGEPLPTAWWKI